MTDSIKKGDFIELDYTGKVAEDGMVFDTTIEAIGKAAGMRKRTFKPAIVCVGERHLLPGLDRQLEGQPLGTHTFSVVAEEGFGKKSAKLLKLIPMKVFREQNVQPMVGLDITVDDQTGIIRAVNGGRIIVDFNHPLSSRDLVYDIDVKRIITDKAAQVDAMLSLLRLPHGAVEMDGENAKVHGVQGLPQEFLELFAKDIVRLTGVKDVTFLAKEGTQAQSPEHHDHHGHEHAHDHDEEHHHHHE